MKSIFKLRKLFVYLALLLCTLGIGTKANAASGKFTAAYIYMDYAGKGSGDYLYRVYVVLYQKCSAGGYGFNTTENVCWSSGTCYAGLGWKTANLKKVDSQIVDAYCNATSASNSCRSTTSTDPGYISMTYSDTIRLAGPCTDWIIYWNPQNGDTYPSTLSSISSPSTYKVGDARIQNFNNTKGATWDYTTRSTPRFTTKPNFYFCPNVLNYFPTNPVSTNGDLVSVNNSQTWYMPNTTTCGAGRNNLTTWYTAGYGVSAPFGPSPSPWTVNPVTGMCTVIPQTPGDFIFDLNMSSTDPVTSTVICNVYNWTIVTVGSTNCGPSAPDLDTIPQNVTGGTLDTTGGINKISICAGTKVEFTVEGKKVGASVYMTYNNKSAPASTVTVTNDGTEDATALFSWTPAGSDVGDHLITIIATDSSCGGGQKVLSRKYIDVIIHVNYSVVASGPYNYCPPILPGDKGSLPDTMHVSGPPGAIFTWLDTAGTPTISCLTCTDPTSAPLFDNTAYFVSSSIATGCKDADTVIIHTFPPDKFNAGPDKTICLNQIVALTATVSPTDKYFWFPGTDLSCTACLTTYVHPTKFGDDTVFLHVTDINKCNYLDTAIVHVVNEAPKLKVFAVPDSVCPEGHSQLYAQVQQPGGKLCNSGGVPSATSVPITADIDAGKSQFVSGPPSYPGDPNIFEHYYYGGQRQQVLYTAKELSAGGTMPGYINSFSVKFNGPMAVTDQFLSFTIKMACTKDSQYSPNPAYPSNYCFLPMPGAITVYNPKDILPTNASLNSGWYTFNFATPFYWDGTTNVLLDMCFGMPYTTSGFANDPLMLVGTPVVRTAYTCQDYYTYYTASYPYSGCVANCGVSSHQYYIFGGTSRPVTRFGQKVDTGLYSYTWTPTTYLDNPNTANPGVNGITKKTTYHVKAFLKSSPGCVSEDSTSVAVDTSNHIVAIPENIVMCRPGYQQLSSKAYGPGPFSNMSCGTNSPVTCATTSTISPGNKVSGNDYASSPFYYYSGKQQFIIRREELLAMGMHSGTIRQMTIYAVPYSSYTYPGNINNFELRVGCTPKTEFTSLADTVPSAQLVQEYTNSSFTLTPGPIVMPFSKPYNWDTTQNLIVQICHGYGVVYLWYVATTSTNFNSAVTWYTYSNISICAGQNPSYNSGAPTKKRPYVDIDYCPAPSLNYFNYTWNPGTYLSDSSIQSPIAYVNNPGKVTTYSVYTRGRNNCLVHDSVNIYQPQHHYSIYPKDTVFCEGGSAKLGVKGASKTTTYQWFQNGYQAATTLSCNTCANPTAMPHNFGHVNVDTFTYQVVMTDSVGCSDTTTSRIEVKPIPIVKTLTHDTTINYNGSVQLFATGAAVYTWSPTATLNNPNIVNPIASPKEPTTYTVRGLSANGCAATDTVHVNINYHGRVFVPTAFTPNGDGKNDVFRVSNVTFEKILEFHVFNRWGQELYYSTDNNGWDGYWHNAPQDIGTYQFLIRVASPDGTIQTFKGDVTLLR